MLAILRSRWQGLNLVVLLAVIVTIVILATGCGSATTGTAAPGGSATTGTAIPSDVKSRLLKNGIEVTGPASLGLGTLRPPAVVATDKAIEVTRSLPGVGNNQPVSVLVSLTDNVYRHSGVRKYVDRLAWLVVYRNVSMPLFGPSRGAGSSGPRVYVADLAAFVDASTGKFLVALTL